MKPTALCSIVLISSIVFSSPVWGLSSEEQAKQLRRKGLVYQSKGDLVAAAEHYRQAIVINPADAAAHNNFALALKSMNRLEDAEEEARNALSLRPDNANYHFNLGLILKAQKDLKKAANSFKKAIELNGKDSEAMYQLSQILMDKDDLDQSERHIRLALELNPRKGEYHRVLAENLSRQKRIQEAIGEYKRVLAIGSPASAVQDAKIQIDYLQKTGGSLPVVIR